MSYKLDTVDSHQVRGAKKAENECRVYAIFLLQLQAIYVKPQTLMSSSLTRSQPLLACLLQIHSMPIQSTPLLPPNLIQ